MDLTIRSVVISEDVTEALKQMEATFGAYVASAASERPAFSAMGVFAISPRAEHPLLRVAKTRRGSYHAATRIYSIYAELDYVAFASSDWATRVRAYADAVSAAVSCVPPTRLTSDERAFLLGVVERACADCAAQPPSKVAIVKPVYLSAGNGGPTFSYHGGWPGMIPVTVDDIPNHKPLVTQHEERLFKLYKKIDGGLHYREAWIPDDQKVVEHWGACGDRGQTREHVCETPARARAAYVQLKHSARSDGFRPIAQSKHAKLVVEIPIEGFGTSGELHRRHALEDFLDDLVGWLGLGHLDGGSSGSGTMEAMCYVVDFKVAKAAVEAALRTSTFSDFSRVYRES